MNGTAAAPLSPEHRPIKRAGDDALHPAAAYEAVIGLEVHVQVRTRIRRCSPASPPATASRKTR